jgi:hypothetical protein
VVELAEERLDCLSVSGMICRRNSCGMENRPHQILYSGSPLAAYGHLDVCILVTIETTIAGMGSLSSKYLDQLLTLEQPESACSVSGSGFP